MTYMKKQILGFVAVGMFGGIYLGALENRKYSNIKFMEHISNISLGGIVGSICCVVFGIAFPFLIPVSVVYSVASIGMYEYNKINTVIPWHQQ